MARSASDATRFTATIPTATSKPASYASSSSARPGETPQQKIARLRAAAAAARAGKESQFDKVVRVGRTWADRAHRTTALSLIGLTVISGVVASFAIGDMLMHNRRKRTEWLAEKQKETAMQVAEARQAEAAGIATEDQILLINRERAAEESAAAKKNKKGIFTRAKESLYGTLSSEEQKGGNLGAAAKKVEDSVEKVGEQISRKGGDLGIVKAVEDHRRQGERPEERIYAKGGVLDQEAELLASKPKGWTSWMTRS